MAGYTIDFAPCSYRAAIDPVRARSSRRSGPADVNNSGLLLVLVPIVGAVLLAPILAIVALVRLNRLEREVAALRDEARRAAVPASIGPPAAAPSSAVPPVVVPWAVPPAAPAASTASASDLERLIAGRWLNIVGLLAVVVGISFFLKLAIDNRWIGPAGQVAIGLAIGAGLVASSRWLHARGYRYFADGVVALGASVLYLSVWAAGSYYHLISIGATFAGLAAVTAAMIALAVGTASQRVAVLAMVGGFLTPVLVSTGQNQEVILFLYLTALDASLLPIAWRRDWRFVELPAFAFTQIYVWGWFARFYAPAALIRTAGFGAVFFAGFAALPLLRGRLGRRFRPEHAVLTLLNAGLTLLLLLELLWPAHGWLLTLAVLALAAVHLGMARATPPGGDDVRVARLVYTAVAVALVAVAIPIQFDRHWTTIAWAVQAASLAWAGYRTEQGYLRGLAFALFAIVGVRLLGLSTIAGPFLRNPRFGVAVVTAACLALTLRFARDRTASLSREERFGLAALAVAVNVVLVWALTLEVEAYFGASQGRVFDARSRLAEGATISLLWIGYASLLMGGGVARRLAILRWQSLALFGLATLKVFAVDMARLSGVYRVVSSIVLGVVLLAISFVYQRRRAGAAAPTREV